MKKLVSILLALGLLLSLSITAAAGDLPPDTDAVSFGGVTVTATGWSLAPGADGVDRLTVYFRARNASESTGELRCAACLLGPCELPACLSLSLEPGESADAALAIPLTPLSYFDLSAYLLDYLRLRFSFTGPAADEPVFSDWLTLRLGERPALSGEEAENIEFFARFGARIRPLGVYCDGQYLSAWLLLENNNDFPLRLTTDGESDDAAHFSFLGGYVQGHSRAAIRADVPLEKTPLAVSFTLRCALSGYVDGEGKRPVDMASLELPLRLGAEDGRWHITLTDEVQTSFDQSYIARVGMREFGYGECTPAFVVDPDQMPLPAREEGLISLACCAGYEVLAGAEQLLEQGGVALTALPLTLRNYTGEALVLALRPVADAVWLPCLTRGNLRAEANGSASETVLFDAGGLAYTEYAGTAELNCGLALCVGPAAGPGRLYGRHPTARHSAAAAQLEPKAAFASEETVLDGLSVRLLGADLSDGLSVWLQIRNDTDAELLFGTPRLDAMLNSTPLSLMGGGAYIPAHAECLVLLRGAVFAEDGTPDPFAFRMPPLSELNTLKFRLGAEEDAKTMTVMFRETGAVMFASIA